MNAREVQRDRVFEINLVSASVYADAYQATYLDPRTGAATGLGPVEPNERGEWQPPYPPEAKDFLLLLTA